MLDASGAGVPPGAALAKCERKRRLDALAHVARRIRTGAQLAQTRAHPRGLVEEREPKCVLDRSAPRRWIVAAVPTLERRQNARRELLVGMRSFESHGIARDLEIDG